MEIFKVDPTKIGPGKNAHQKEETKSNSTVFKNVGKGPRAVEDLVRQALEAFSCTQGKLSYQKINSDLKKHLTLLNQPADNKQHPPGTVLNNIDKRIFNFVDAELNTRKTTFEARIYLKLLVAIEKTGFLSKSYVATLKSKADRFLDKEKVPQKGNTRDKKGKIFLSQNSNSNSDSDWTINEGEGDEEELKVIISEIKQFNTKTPPRKVSHD
jgi:hypothetical protein